MKIQYCSDLHLELSANNKLFSEIKLQPVGDILLLAGDITFISERHFQDPIFDYFSNNFKQVYWLPGNHEFYSGFDLFQMEGPYNKAIRDNVFLVNNTSIEIQGIAFLFSTLWSKILNNQWYIESHIADFSFVKYKDKKLRVADFNKVHQSSFEYIENAAKKYKHQKKVVISHHVPSLICNPEIYKNNALNEAFTVELTPFIEKSGIDYWIYGHNHFNMANIEIGKTKMLSNQMGYIEDNMLECEEFDRGGYFELS